MSKTTIKVSHYQEMASESSQHIGRSYKGLPILANRGIHEFVAENLATLLDPGSHLLELGSGSGALSLRGTPNSALPQLITSRRISAPPTRTLISYRQI